MTDWDLISEYIQNAMRAVDEAHEATNDLREKATPEALDDFRSHLVELTEHLTKLQTALNNQGIFALEEMADWLTSVFGDKHIEYRRTPRMGKSITP